MDIDLSDDEKHVLKVFKTENGLGKFIDDEFIKRRFGGHPFEGGLDGFGITEQLVTKKAVIKYVYSNKTWFVLNDKYALKVVVGKNLEEEYKVITANISNASGNKGQKNLFELKRSILDTIRNDIEKKITAHAESDDSEAVLQKDKSEQNINGLLKSEINKCTAKFINTFSILDLASNENVFKKEFTVGEINYTDIGQVLDALVDTGEIIRVNMSKQESFFLDSTLISEDFIRQLAVVRNEAKNNFESDSKSENMPEYRRYVVLDTIYNLIAGEGHSQPKNDTSEVSLKNITNEDVEGKTTAEEKEADVNEEQNAETEEHPVEEENKDNVESHIDLLLKEIKYDSSREVLKSYIEKIINEHDKEVKSEYFRTFFTSLSVLIKITDFDTKRLYELAKEVLNEFEDYAPEDVVMHELMGLERSFEIHQQKMLELKFLDKRSIDSKQP